MKRAQGVTIILPAKISGLSTRSMKRAKFSNINRRKETNPMLTTVINLSTGEELQYLNIPPEKAVIFAYLNSIGKRNTWEYSQLYEKNK